MKNLRWFPDFDLDQKKLELAFIGGGVKQGQNMKLAVFTSSLTGSASGKNGRQAAESSFKDFRALAKLQPPYDAVRLARLARGVEQSIKSGHPERYRRARWLEEAVARIVERRPQHAETLKLQQCLTRLLRQSFDSLDWRRRLIAGLKPARSGVSAQKRPVSSATL
jgi:hypothetical protein